MPRVTFKQLSRHLSAGSGGWLALTITESPCNQIPRTPPKWKYTKQENRNALKRIWMQTLLGLEGQAPHTHKCHSGLLSRRCLSTSVLIVIKIFLKMLWCGEFPSSPLVRTLPSNTEGAGSIPGHRAKTPHASGMKKPKCKTEGLL